MDVAHLLLVFNCSVLMLREGYRRDSACVICFDPVTYISTSITLLQLFPWLSELRVPIVSIKSTVILSLSAQGRCAQCLLTQGGAAMLH